jgi:two-component system osmolarity sensor histidine kinase EnvZ
VIVRDAGAGIPEDQLEKVFRPFYRLEGSRSQTTGGTGLGLAIVRQLAETNGCRVALRNRTAGGLEAVLELPR